MEETWNCPTCLVTNNCSDDVCACCSTKRSEGSQTFNPIKKESNLKGVKRERSEAASSDKKSAKTKVKVKQEDPSSAKDSVDIKIDRGCFLYICGSSEMDQIPLTSRDEVAVRTSGGVTNYTDTYEAKLPNPIVYFRKKPVKKVACGALHTAVLLEDGTVYTFGCNDLGALGRNISELDKAGMSDETEPVIIKMDDKVTDVTCGDNHTCLLTVGGDVYLTGSFKDTSGPIGFPNFTTDGGEILDKVTLPVKVIFDKKKKVTITNISSGENHVVCLNSNLGDLYVFGSNEYGQLLQPITDDSPNISRDKLFEIKGKKLYPKLIDPKIFGFKANKSQGGEKIVQAFTGYATTFLVTNKQRVFGCGRNAQGEVGVGKSIPFIDKPIELAAFTGKSILDIKGGQFFTIALEKGGFVHTWGKTCFSGQSVKSTNIPTPKKLPIDGKLGATAVFVGSDFAFAKMSNDKIYAWGSAQNYVLGNGQDIEFQLKPVLVDLDKLGVVATISGGAQHTVFHVIPESVKVGTKSTKQTDTKNTKPVPKTTKQPDTKTTKQPDPKTTKHQDTKATNEADKKGKKGDDTKATKSTPTDVKKGDDIKTTKEGDKKGKKGDDTKATKSTPTDVKKGGDPKATKSTSASPTGSKKRKSK